VIDTRIGKANAVLHELYRSVALKHELSNAIKLSVFKSIFVPILTYGHESWVMTERIINSGASTKDRIFEKTPRCGKGAYQGCIAPGTRNKFGASIYEPKLFWD